MTDDKYEIAARELSLKPRGFKSSLPTFGIQDGDGRDMTLANVLRARTKLRAAQIAGSLFLERKTPCSVLAVTAETAYAEFSGPSFSSLLETGNNEESRKFFLLYTRHKGNAALSAPWRVIAPAIVMPFTVTSEELKAVDVFLKESDDFLERKNHYFLKKGFNIREGCDTYEQVILR